MFVPNVMYIWDRKFGGNVKKLPLFFFHNIRIYHKCEGRIEKSVQRIAVWHRKACRVMTNGDLEGQISMKINSI